jgi:hypothetical protein
MRTLFLTLITCLFVLPAYAKYSGGIGEPNDPYQIATAADLIALGETPEDYDKHFILTADIDLDPNLPGRKVFDKAVIAPDTNDIESGFQGTAFTGMFHGNGHTISDLTVNGGSYLGLFGKSSGAEVNELGVVGVNIVGSGSCVGALVGMSELGPLGRAFSLTQCYSTGAVSGTSRIGGLVGMNGYEIAPVGAARRRMTNCSSTAAVSGGDYVGGLVGENSGGVTESHSTNAVSGGMDVGGLVGLNLGSVIRCHSASIVIGVSEVGGLVGANGGEKKGGPVIGNVADSYSTGTVSGNSAVGGLVGANGGALIRCYTNGEVSGSSVGGLVGRGSLYIHFGGLFELNGTVTACFWDIQTSGQATSAGGAGKTTAEMQTASTFLEAGWDFVGETANGSEDIWKIAECLGYPRLWWEKYSGGTGDPNNPYQIATAEDLIALGNEPNDYDKHFFLVADIDLDPNLPGRKVFDRAVIAGNADPTKEYWQGTAFTGIFDGGGHAIAHLTIKGGSYLGLFGYLDVDSAEVKNIGVMDVNITGSGDYVGGLVGWNGETVANCYSAGSVSGKNSVGGLVGSNCGIVTECYSTGAVSGGQGVGGLVGYNVDTVTQCYSTGAVSGRYYVGGLVGYNVGTVTNCYNTGVITGSGAYVGGLVGYNVDTVTQCYSTGAVRGTGNSVGGLVGENDESGLISDCYGTGAVSASEAVGGLVGKNGGTVSRCYSTGAVTGSGKEYIGGLVGCPWVWGGTAAPGHEIRGLVSNCFWDNQTSGQATSGGGTGKTTAQMQDPNTFVAAGWDFVNQPDGPHDIWSEPEGGGYPIFWWQLPTLPNLPEFSGGMGDPNSPYLILTAEELNSIGHNPRLMECHFKLVNDIDLTGLHFNPIGNLEYPYRGVFDGSGFTISNLTVTGEDYVGLFGCLERGSEVKDLGVIDVNIVGSGDCVGGLAGSNSGNLTHCYSTGSVTGQRHDVGGLVGSNAGSITDCSSSSVVVGIGWQRSSRGDQTGVGALVGTNTGFVTRCRSDGAVAGDSYIGGLVGVNSGDVTQCYSSAVVNGTGGSSGGLVGCNWGCVADCYSTGAVHGDGWVQVGGLVGANQNDGTVDRCYCTGSVSSTPWPVENSQPPSGGLVAGNYAGHIGSSFWDTQTSGKTKSNGATGKTTAEMQTAKTFLDAGWDFVGETANGTEDIWWILEGKDYPRLWWQAAGQ